MANLDIAERRAPQDGRIGLTRRRPLHRHPGRDPAGDARRVGGAANPRQGAARHGPRPARDAGATTASCSSDAVTRSHGAVLVTGPTGSGKTTTLYATLAEINTPDKTLITIEDPVEYELDGVKQIQVNPKVGPHLRRRPALDDPLRPRRPDGRRDPRPRDRADRDRVGADRAPRALHPAHQRRADGAGAADRDGDRAVPGRLGDRVRGRPATRPPALRGVQARRSRSPPRSCAGAVSTPPTGRSRPTSRSAACAATAPAIRGRVGDLRGDEGLASEIRSLILDKCLGRRDRGRRGRRRDAADAQTTASRRCARGSPRSPRSSASSAPERRPPSRQLPVVYFQVVGLATVLPARSLAVPAIAAVYCVLPASGGLGREDQSVAVPARLPARERRRWSASARRPLPQRPYPSAC